MLAGEKRKGQTVTKRRTHRLVITLGFLLGAAACAEDLRDSRFGIDYVYAGLPLHQDPAVAEALAGTGAAWVEISDVHWSHLEPQPPTKRGHTYRWDILDRAVQVWQKRFRIAIWFRIGAGWYAGPVKYRPDIHVPLADLACRSSDRLPADEHRENFRAFIRAMVERYDGDGKDDMPGLARPILHYQVGNECTDPIFWTGTAEDYRTFLMETREAARSVCPDVRIVSNGLRWNDFFHEDPSAGRFEERFAAHMKKLPGDGWRDVFLRTRAINELTVALAGSYEVLDAGGNGPYPGSSAGYMAWVRKELAKTGGKPVIWDMEARCEPLAAFNPIVDFFQETFVPEGAKLLRALKSETDAGHADAVAWYRAEQCRVLTKVFVTRFAAGFEKVFMGYPSDLDGTIGALFTPNPYLGILDSKGRPWPALKTMALLVDKLDGFTKAQQVEAEAGVDLYRFDFAVKKPVWVAWLHESKARGMSAALPSRKVRLAGLPTPLTARIVPTSNAVSADIPFDGTIDLTPTPVLLSNE